MSRLGRHEERLQAMETLPRKSLVLFLQVLSVCNKELNELYTCQCLRHKRKRSSLGYFHVQQHTAQQITHVPMLQVQEQMLKVVEEPGVPCATPTSVIEYVAPAPMIGPSPEEHSALECRSLRIHRLCTVEMDKSSSALE